MGLLYPRLLSQQVWAGLWSDLAERCWLFWRWIMPSLLLKQWNWC